MCEAAAFYKAQGLTLWDQLINIYNKYGYYKEELASISLKGEEGSTKIRNIIDNMRKNPPRKIGEFHVIAVRDYKEGKRLDLLTNELSKTDLPESNVLYYELADDGWCCIRPSGTEPRIKFYMGVKGKDLKDSDHKVKELKKALLELVEII